MSIKTISGLQRKLDREFSWRKKECVTLAMNLMREQDNQLVKKINYKAGITLLYAHWETLIKKSAIYYVKHLNKKQLKFHQLKPCFLYFSLSQQFDSKIKNFAVFEKVSSCFHETNEDVFSQVNHHHISKKDTQNMKSEEFKTVLSKIGLEYRPDFSLKENLIDISLLGERNKIAHEGIITTNEDDLFVHFKKIHDSVWEILDTFKDDLISAAENESYLR